jgi:hypothetical protein
VHRLIGVRQADREGFLQVVPRVGPNRDVRVGAQDAGGLRDAVGDDLGDLVVLLHPDHGDQVDVAGDGVHLADPVEVR